MIVDDEYQTLLDAARNELVGFERSDLGSVQLACAPRDHNRLATLLVEIKAVVACRGARASVAVGQRQT